MFDFNEEKRKEKDTVINLFQGTTKTGALKKELIEIGRCELPYLTRKLKSERYTYEEKQAYETVLKMVQTLFGRFSIFEKPNGGSFYVLVI